MEQLILFEGKRVDESDAKLAGKIPLDGDATFQIGETVYYVVAASVAGINHETKGERGLCRTHKLEIDNAARIAFKDFSRPMGKAKHIA